MRLSVPPGPVLLGQRDELAMGPGPSRAAGIGEQHQSEQPGDFAVAGQRPVQQPGQADGFVGQVRALQVRAGGGRVALGEHRLGHQERPRNLRGAQPADRAQRQRRSAPPRRGRCSWYRAWLTSTGWFRGNARDKLLDCRSWPARDLACWHSPAGPSGASRPTTRAL